MWQAGPAGSTSAQVEASYRFGFYGITNTISNVSGSTNTISS